jgi:acyl-coenzyme A synthetase/AMP-(fatty) acid ligase
VPPGKVGEVVVKGPQVSLMYFNAPEHDRLAKIADGTGVRHRMGDLGYFDDRGRLWFCGRKAHRVRTAQGELFTVPCEAVFNTHPKVFRTALVGVRRADAEMPVLCVELEKGVRRSERAGIRRELQEIAARFDHTRNIREVLFHPGFPVDIRHNAKIGREALARWAAKRLDF